MSVRLADPWVSSSCCNRHHFNDDFPQRFCRLEHQVMNSISDQVCLRAVLSIDLRLAGPSLVVTAVKTKLHHSHLPTIFQCL